jgi:tetrahydromethanopterin S-methyltransferase subunit G
MTRNRILATLEEEICKSSLGEEEKNRILQRIREPGNTAFDGDACRRTGETIGRAMGSVAGAIIGEAISGVFENMRLATQSAFDETFDDDASLTDASESVAEAIGDFFEGVAEELDNFTEEISAAAERFTDDDVHEDNEETGNG